MSSHETLDNAAKLVETSARDVSLTLQRAGRKACRPIKKMSTGKMLIVKGMNAFAYVAIPVVRKFFGEEELNPRSHN